MTSLQAFLEHVFRIDHFLLSESSARNRSFSRDDGPDSGEGSSQLEVINVGKETSPAKRVYIMSEEAVKGVYRVRDEVSLLRSSLDGETEAWGEIITRYKEAVFGLCLGFLRNRADAEDLTHDTFIRAYQNLRRYRLEKRFSTWLFTIASNLCRNRLRYRRYHPVYSPPEEVSGGGDPAVVVSREDLYARADEVARNIASHSPVAVRYAKEAVNRGLELTLGEALVLERKLARIVASSRGVA